MKRLTLALVLVTLASAALCFPGTASANDADEPWSFVSDWRPTGGDVATGPGTVFPNVAIATFKWGNEIALSALDYPRTISGRGTYEHSLQFQANGSGQAFCEGDWIDVLDPVLMLPADSYFDTVGPEANEFAVGLPSVGVVKNTLYSFSFECQGDGTSANGGSSYLVTGQIGHCHVSAPTPCSTFTTYSDSTVRLIPALLGNAPDFESFGVSLHGNPSFENTLTPWTTVAGTGARICNSNARLGNCFMRVTPNNSNSQSRAVVTVQPPNGLGIAAAFSEARLMCPASQSACNIESSLTAYDTYDNPIQTFSSGFHQQIPGLWYYSDPIQLNGMPAGTVYWKFKFESQGQTFGIDYSVQNYFHQ